jgi:hypothetical protein
LGRYKTTWKQAKVKADVRRYIEDFMKTLPGTFEECDQTDIDEEFERLTDG